MKAQDIKYKREYVISVQANSEKDCKDALNIVKRLLPRFSTLLEWKRPNKFHVRVELNPKIGDVDLMGTVFNVRTNSWFFVNGIIKSVSRIFFAVSSLTIIGLSEQKL